MDTNATSCFVTSASDLSKSEVLTLSFVPDGCDDFVSALSKQGTFASEESGSIKFIFKNPEVDILGEMKNGKWVVYAGHAMVLHFWDLAKVIRFRLSSIYFKLTQTSLHRKPTLWISF